VTSGLSKDFQKKKKRKGKENASEPWPISSRLLIEEVSTAARDRRSMSSMISARPDSGVSGGDQQPSAGHR